MDPATQDDWLLWQLADSAFPTGGFAHSGGVEAAFQYGEINGRETLIAFLEAALNQAGQGALPFVSAAFDQIEPFARIDSHCDAFNSNHVANRASRLQGRAFLNSVVRAFALEPLQRFREELEYLPCHFAPVFGAVAQCLQIEKPSTLRLFLFTQLRGWISSAVRLGIIGPLEAQNIQRQLSPVAEQTVESYGELGLDDVAQTAPLIDLFQGSQDRLYSRLFQS
jgi:urease accessory protein